MIDKKIKFDLTRYDSNIFSLLGHFVDQARLEKWTKVEMDEIKNSVTSASSYDEALRILISHSEEPGIKRPKKIGDMFMDDDDDDEDDY